TERPVLERAQVVHSEALDGFADQFLGLGVALLCCTHEPKYELRRRARHAVVRADRLPRLERKALGLVDPSLLDEHHRERALCFAQRPAIVETLQRPDRIAKELLRPVEVTLRES